MTLLSFAAVLAAVAALHLGPVQSHRATYYSVPPCDNQGTITASGERVHFGVIASNFLPLRTRIRMERPIHGRRFFQVLDTGAAFDVWLPCGPWAAEWQNPVLKYRVVSR